MAPSPMPPAAHISHLRASKHGATSSSPRLLDAQPAPLANPPSIDAASGFEWQLAEGKRGLAGLPERASRSRRCWRRKWPRRWVPSRGWAGSRGSTRAGLTLSAFRARAAAGALRVENQDHILAGRNSAAGATRRGRTRKKITAELSPVIVAASSRAAASRPAVTAKSTSA